MIQQISHTDETPYTVDDYPYGFRLRTQIRYWVETKPGKGQRSAAQTLNPKTGKWNKPKYSSYSAIVIPYLEYDAEIGKEIVKFWHITRSAWADQIEKFEAQNFVLNDFQAKELKLIKACITVLDKVFSDSRNTNEPEINDDGQDEPDDFPVQYEDGPSLPGIPIDTSLRSEFEHD